MIQVKCKLMGVSPYSQSKALFTEKKGDETHQDHEARVWRERMHVNQDGQVVIPPMAFKNMIAQAAKRRSMKIPGENRKTYTKHFESGVLVLEECPLAVAADDVKGEWLFVPSNGQRGGGTRVHKCFPIIHKWECSVTFTILDRKITKPVFVEHLEEAGNFTGIGRFRPANNGYYGRFRVESVDWPEAG